MEAKAPRGEPEPGRHTRGCRILSVATLVNTHARAHTHGELLGGGWLFEAEVAGVHACIRPAQADRQPSMVS